MSKFRTVFGAVVMALLTLGYVASQRAAFDGTAPQYAAFVDQKSISLISLLVLLLAIGLCLYPDREEPQA